MRSGAVVSILLCLAGCGSSQPAKEPAAGGGADRGGAGQASFETPRAAAETFLRAAEDGDAELLRQCMARDAEGEFRPLAEGTASGETLGELGGMFADGSVRATETAGKTAQAHVELPSHRRGRETLNLVKEGDVWRVRGF